MNVHPFTQLTLAECPGTKVPTPLASLFRQEDTLVLLARSVCPMTLAGNHKRQRRTI